MKIDTSTFVNRFEKENSIEKITQNISQIQKNLKP